MTIIDSHCHLDFPDFANDLDGVVERARAAGVERMITIGTKVSKAAGVVAIAERYDDVFFTVGTHPHEAAGEDAEDFDAMRAFARHPKCVGIGEAGLDYHYDNAPRDVAQRVFRGHIALARELDLPLVIHTRDADDDMARDPDRGNGAGAVPRPAPLFHRLARTRRDRARPWALDLVFRRGDVQEVGGLARHRPRRPARPHPGRDRRALSRADAPSRPPQRAGVRRRHGGRGRRGARDRRRKRWPRRRAPTPTQSFAGCRRPSASCRRLAGRARIVALTLRLTILGCASSGGVPRVGEGWGACDPANPKNRRRRCSVLVERFGSDGATDGPRRHVARLARATDRRRGQAARRRPFEPSPRRPHARHRRSEAALPGHAPPSGRAYERADLAQNRRKPSPIFFKPLTEVLILRSQPNCA